jgi:hypothetical protein
MRRMALTFTLLLWPLIWAYGDDARYHYVNYGGGTTSGSNGSMEYWDSEGYARQNLMGTPAADQGPVSYHGFAGLSPTETQNFCSQQMGQAACMPNHNLSPSFGNAPLPLAGQSNNR